MLVPGTGSCSCNSLDVIPPPFDMVVGGGLACARLARPDLCPDLFRTARRFRWLLWSRRRESNSHSQLGKLMFYH